MWDVELNDGTKMGFYGYQSGPHYDDGPRVDGSLWDDNQELYEWLLHLSSIEVPYWNPEGPEAVEFDLSLKRARSKPNLLVATVTNIQVYHSEGDGVVADKAIPYPGVYTYNLKY